MNKFLNILKYLLIFISLYFVNESAAFLVKYNKYSYSLLLFVLILLIFMFMVIIKHKKTFERKKMFLLIVSLCIILLSMVLNNDFDFENYLIIIGVLIAYMLSNIFSSFEFYEKFVNIILILSIFALITTYVIVPLAMSSKITFLNVYYNQLNVPYFDVFFSYGVAYVNIVRTMSIFREPGIYQIYLLIALIIYTFYLKKQNYFVILFLVVMILSTFSSAGIVCLIPVLLCILFSNNILNKRTKQSLCFLIILAIGVLLVTNSELILNKLFYTINKVTDLSDESASTRYESIMNLILVSFNNLLYGNSLVNGLRDIHENYSSYNNTNVTGTFFVFLMAYGLPLFSVLIYSFYSFCRKIVKNNILSIIIFISLFLSINTQNIVYSWFLWLLMFYGVDEEKNEKN